MKLPPSWDQSKSFAKNWNFAIGRAPSTAGTPVRHGAAEAESRDPEIAARPYHSLPVTSHASTCSLLSRRMPSPSLRISSTRSSAIE